MTGKLNERQTRFVSAYLKNPNATQAAIAAGYSPNSAPANGPRMLENAEVKAALAERSGRAVKKADAAVDRIVAELANIGFSDVTTIFVDSPDGPKLRPLAEWPPEIRCCIASIKTSRRSVGIKAVAGDEPGEDSLVYEAEIITEVKLWPKTQALQMLGQYRKMFGDSMLGAGSSPFAGLQVIVAPGAALQINAGGPTNAQAAFLESDGVSGIKRLK